MSDRTVSFSGGMRLRLGSVGQREDGRGAKGGRGGRGWVGVVGEGNPVVATVPRPATVLEVRAKRFLVQRMYVLMYRLALEGSKVDGATGETINAGET
jgi:hypothetical protein